MLDKLLVAEGLFCSEEEFDQLIQELITAVKNKDESGIVSAGIANCGETDSNKKYKVSISYNGWSFGEFTVAVGK